MFLGYNDKRSKDIMERLSRYAERHGISSMDVPIIYIMDAPAVEYMMRKKV